MINSLDAVLHVEKGEDEHGQTICDSNGELTIGRQALAAIGNHPRSGGVDEVELCEVDDEVAWPLPMDTSQRFLEQRRGGQIQLTSHHELRRRARGVILDREGGVAHPSDR